MLIGDDDSIGLRGHGRLLQFLPGGWTRPADPRPPARCRRLRSRAGRRPVAVISERSGAPDLGSDPSVVGRVVRINNRPVTVVGVVPDRTAGWTRPPASGLPYTAQTYFDPGRDFFARDEVLWLKLAGRLAPGLHARPGRPNSTILAKQQDACSTGRCTVVTTTDGSWIEEFDLTLSGRVPDARRLLPRLLLPGAAHLLRQRGDAAALARRRPRREIAVRLSLGAPRVRLVRMLVTESLLLAAVAGAPACI